MAPQASIRGLVGQFLDERKPARIASVEWEALMTWLGREVKGARRVNPRYILELLHETGIEVERSLGGLPLDLRGRVHSKDAEAAAESLLAMSAEYARARAAGDGARAEDVRRAVRQAKDRLRFTLGRKNVRPETRAAKQQLLEWFLIWLENPLVFPAWLEVRRVQSEGPR